ncbi:MAG: hypothetical protein KGZ80_01315 [Methylomonas sp.]|nr:hypothetical protein [Methylomonas sp.]PPD22645.1 MAG: hypothetical protein CTY23_01825 [Methylomonas sp.]PPD27957.1 MAG: hypothetical protein CTY22_00710 [Methylomonas sp.]PPD40066.1 MAG: hypothetical protein CTY21_00705 [Methylomonas sp.]PPD41546.1 MAG: hypothetical protein CTY17_03445 [Methylomonas sp.]
MNSRLLKIQLGLVAILASTLVSVWLLGYHDHQALQSGFKAQKAPDYAAVSLPALDLADRSTAQLTEVIERPVFIEGRKPIVEEEPANVVVTDSGQLDDWELIGVYFKADKTATALFRKRSEAKKYLKARENQAVSGWVIKDIQGDRVMLAQSDQQKTLMLLKPRPQASKPGAVPKPPSAARAIQPPPVVQPNIPPSEAIEE